MDLAELWKRTVLNLLVGNKDNHLRNHGFQPHHDRAVRDGFDGVMRQRTREVLGERPAPSCWISPHMTPPLDRWGDAVSVGARFSLTGVHCTWLRPRMLQEGVSVGVEP